MLRIVELNLFCMKLSYFTILLCKLFGYLKPTFNEEYISDYLENQGFLFKEDRLSSTWNSSKPRGL